MDESTQFLYDNYYTYYADYKATEQWNRPEFTAMETEEANALRTDIDKLWKENQARWITGAGDIDAEWAAYIAQLKRMNVDRYVELYQIAHTRFVEGQK